MEGGLTLGLLSFWLESLDQSIQINSSCLREVSRFSTCNQCIKKCPIDALYIEKDKVKIADSCNACGECITVCPMESIEGIIPQRKIYQDTLIYDNKNNVSEKELLYLYHKGIRKIALMEHQLNKDWEKVLQDVNGILNVMEKAEIETIQKIAIKEENPEVSRRELLGQFKKEGKLFLFNLTPATWRYNHKDFSLQESFLEWSFYQIEIDQNSCNLCQLCFKICPKQVFEIKDQQILIHSNRCVGCHLCEDVCKENSIHIKKHFHNFDEKSYLVIEKQCVNCNQQFLAWEKTEKVCFVCSHHQ